jgi:ATP-dependent Clp protease ATP-binding subunit ClpC
MFERYTEEAKRAIFFARYEAGFVPDSKITIGLILAGILREGDWRSAAVKSLEKNERQLRSILGIPAPNLKVLKILADHKKEIPLDQNAKLALAYAAKEAEIDHSSSLNTDHLLRGILCFANEAAEALQSVGMTLDIARAAYKSQDSKFPGIRLIKESVGTLYWWLFGRPFRAHRSSLLKLIIFICVVLFSTILIQWLN